MRILHYLKGVKLKLLLCLWILILINRYQTLCSWEGFCTGFRKRKTSKFGCGHECESRVGQVICPEVDINTFKFTECHKSNNTWIAAIFFNVR